MQSRRDTTKPSTRDSALPVPSSEAIAASRASFCRYLINARESSGLSLEEIAAKTRVPARSLELIEAGEFEKLPADVFVRGFLRSYARCVNLDSDELIRRYGDCGMTPAPVASPIASSLASQMATLDSGGSPAYRVRPLARLQSESGDAPQAGLPAAGSEPVESWAVDDGNHLRRDGESEARAESAPALSLLPSLPSAAAERPGRPGRELDALGASAAREVSSPGNTYDNTSDASPVASVVPVEQTAAVAAHHAPEAAPVRASTQAAGKQRSEPKSRASRKQRSKRKNRKRAATQSAGAAAAAELALTAESPAASVPAGAPAAAVSAQPDRPDAISGEPSLSLASEPTTSLLSASPLRHAAPHEPLLASSHEPLLPAPDESAAASTADGPGQVSATARTVMPPPVLVIDDDCPDEAEKAQEARAEAERDDPAWRQFLPPSLLDGEEGSRRGALTLAVIILVIVATLTMSYLLRRPSYSGDGVTRGVLTPGAMVASAPRAGAQPG